MTKHIYLEHLRKTISEGTVFKKLLKSRQGSHTDLPFEGMLVTSHRYDQRPLQDVQVEAGGWQAWHIWCIEINNIRFGKQSRVASLQRNLGVLTISEPVLEI